MTKPTVVEICGGAGGQGLGLERAGFRHLLANEIDPDACATLRLNRPGWKVDEGDVRNLDGNPYRGITDLLAGGVPCQPFSVGGHQLGTEDERDMFPEALRLVGEILPKAVMFENVPGLLQGRFHGYREEIRQELYRLGYSTWWRVVKAADYGVPQLRPRAVLIAMRGIYYQFFEWPRVEFAFRYPVGMALYDLMAANGWEGAFDWASRLTDIAPTLVGGSKKHGGADLGPTRAKQAWEAMGVNGKALADEAPGPGHEGLVKLTLRMTARLQGFPDDWQFCGGKTARYRQIGNAFPPPVAQALGEAIRKAIS